MNSFEQAYREAARDLKTLQQRQTSLQQELGNLTKEITQAEAACNKAREALLRHVEEGHV